MLKTTIAGSLPKPSWLAEPETLWAPWRFDGPELQAAKEDAALLWLKEQEDAGIDIVSDGEQFRSHFVHGFLEHISGIDWNKKTKMGIRDNRYVVDVPTVTAAVTRPAPVHLADVRFARAHTSHALKFTLPGPMTICDTIADGHYGKRADMAMAFAAVLNEEARDLEAAGVDVIQFDEPAFNVFMDDVKEWGIAALHRAIEGDWNPLIYIPVGFWKMIDRPSVNWCFESEPEEGTHNRKIPIPRGKVLGGSSSINGMLYVRGQPLDYDTWAQLGNRGWSYDEVLPFFKRSENFERGGDDYRGTGGELNVADMIESHTLLDAYVEAGAEIGYPKMQMAFPGRSSNRELTH